LLCSGLARSHAVILAVTIDAVAGEIEVASIADAAQTEVGIDQHAIVKIVETAPHGGHFITAKIQIAQPEAAVVFPPVRSLFIGCKLRDAVVQKTGWSAIALLDHIR